MIRHYDLTKSEYNNLKINNKIDNNALYFIDGKLYKGNNSYGEYLSLDGGTLNNNANITVQNGNIKIQDTNNVLTTITPTSITVNNNNMSAVLTNNLLSINNVNTIVLEISAENFIYNSNNRLNTSILIDNQGFIVNNNQNSLSLTEQLLYIKRHNNNLVQLLEFSDDNVDIFTRNSETSNQIRLTLNNNITIDENIFNIQYTNSNNATSILRATTIQLIYNTINNNVFTITPDDNLITLSNNNINWLSIDGSNMTLNVSNILSYNNNNQLLYVGNHNSLDIDSIFVVGDNTNTYVFSNNNSIYGFDNKLPATTTLNTNNAALIINQNGFTRIHNGNTVSLTINNGLQINDYVNISNTIFSVTTKINNTTLNVQATDTFKIINNTAIMEVTDIGIKENNIYLQDKYGVQTLTSEPTITNAIPNVLYRYEGNLYIGNCNNAYIKLCNSNTESDVISLQNRIAVLEAAVNSQANKIEALEEALTLINE